MPPRSVDSLLEVTRHGLQAVAAGLHLDAGWAPGAVFVSHAHADHALGKGQEALFHLTRQGYDVAVHGAIARLCQLHVELGYPFPGPGIWTPYRRGEVGRRVLLTTPATRTTAMVQGLAKKRIAYLTGWANHPGAHNIYRGCDLVLPFSDHADYDELVRTARESGASRIYTVHGPRGFATRLNALGMTAEHLVTHPQDLCDDEDMPAAGAMTDSRLPAQGRLELS